MTWSMGHELPVLNDPVRLEGYRAGLLGPYGIARCPVCNYVGMQCATPGKARAAAVAHAKTYRHHIHVVSSGKRRETSSRGFEGLL